MTRKTNKCNIISKENMFAIVSKIELNQIFEQHMHTEVLRGMMLKNNIIDEKRLMEVKRNKRKWKEEKRNNKHGEIIIIPEKNE